MITIPNDVIEKLKFFCNEHKLGFSQIAAADFSVLIMGNNELGPNVVSLMAANMLIGGVLQGIWQEANEQAQAREEKRIVN